MRNDVPSDFNGASILHVAQNPVNGSMDLEFGIQLVVDGTDGKVLYGTLGQPSDAERYYLFSNHGRMGHRFKVASQFCSSWS